MKRSNELLQDAIGMIDDDLVTEARPNSQRKPQRSTFLKWGALAACLTVAFTTTAILLAPSFKTPSITPPISQSISITPPISESTYYPPTVATNLWELDSFDSFSVIFGKSESAAAPQFSSLSATTTNSLQSNLLTMDIPMVKLESFLDKRYIIYYEELGIPIFYDLQENCEINLEDRILGENRFDEQKFYTVAEQMLEERCPGVTLSENNRIYFREQIDSGLNHIPFTPSVEPDLTYVKINYPSYVLMEDWLLKQFKSDCTAAISNAYNVLGDEYAHIPCRVRLLGVDSVNGICVVCVVDLIGNCLNYLTYNLTTNECKPLPQGISGSMLQFGMVFHFSHNGSIATVSYPYVKYFNPPHYAPYHDLWQRQTFPSTSYRITYYGEQYGCFFLDDDIVYSLNSVTTVRGMSQLYIAPNSNTVYFKKFNFLHAERIMNVDSIEWYNRFDQFESRKADEWVFYSFTNPTLTFPDRSIILHGKFVRFIANETAVIMEQEGKYHVYSLESGEDITEKVMNYEIPLMAHDRLQIYLEEGYLYSKDLFSDEAPRQIARADQVIFSNDGAFAFLYTQGDTFVTCLNVASLDACRIEIAPALCEQLFSTPNAVFQMIYKEDENILTLSFYQESKPE